ncbi:hypothetical protein BDQ12DRAFT_69163 [Crucibulum laeve]|uniref:Uncharacterized protein n=1 Tax=Crucibulum laeve TaxID=68775 RepID=A0A5C3LFG4_9AGAR|nr:hypothetical protein BDQ12DRAFT_69163 [Crucibulum laeve]
MGHSIFIGAYYCRAADPVEYSLALMTLSLSSIEAGDVGTGPSLAILISRTGPLPSISSTKRNCEIVHSTRFTLSVIWTGLLYVVADDHKSDRTYSPYAQHTIIRR